MPSESGNIFGSLCLLKMLTAVGVSGLAEDTFFGWWTHPKDWGGTEIITKYSRQVLPLKV